MTLGISEPGSYYALEGLESEENETSGNSTSESLTEQSGNQSAPITQQETVPPEVIAVEPPSESTRVDTQSIINATFSEPMNSTTINTDSFTVADEFGNILSGSVTYNSTTNTASFTLEPFSAMNFGATHTVTLTDEIEDESGNKLNTFSWNFTTGGQIQIFLRDIHKRGIFPANLIPGSAFTITPNPFTLNDSLLVEDNGEFDSMKPTNGVIFVDNVHFSTYLITETVVPENFTKMYDNHVLTIIHTNIRPAAESMSIENRDPSIPITDISQPIRVPAPDLNPSQFQLYKDNATPGIFSGVQGDSLITPSPITYVGPNTIPIAKFATATTLEQIISAPIFSVLFSFPSAPAGSTAQELFDSYLIPTYPAPTEDIASEIFYVPPAFVIPYEDSKDNFVLTPLLEKVFPGMPLRLQQPSFVDSQVAKVEQVNMTFAIEATNVGFSFGISDIPSPGTPEPPLDAPALFLDIGFVGTGDFSDPNSFQSSPKIDILVNKTLPGFPELPNGCPDFRLLFFNGTGWEEIQKLNPTGNFTDFCPFVLEPEHFSKFAVGGVKGQTISTENPPSNDDEGQGTSNEERHRGGGGGSRSTGVTSIPSGNDVETTATTGSGTVMLEFETVEAGSGQLVVDTNQLSAFEDIFDDIAMMALDNDEHGIVRMNGMTYATTGNIFDIDASEVKYQGAVEITIPYDEDTVTLFSGSESNARFLHYDEETGVWEDATASVDELANTVTGILDSLSPVVAAVVISQGITFDEEYFDENPLARLEVARPSFSISEQTGEVTITTTVTNMQRINQGYVIVTQIVDENNVAHYIERHGGSAASGQNVAASIKWKPMEKGSYSVMIFVMTEFDNPVLLSKAVLADVDIQQL